MSPQAPRYPLLSETIARLNLCLRRPISGHVHLKAPQQVRDANAERIRHCFQSLQGHALASGFEAVEMRPV